MLIEEAGEHGFAVASFAEITFENIDNLLFFIFDAGVELFYLGLQTYDLGKIGTVLAQGVVELAGKIPMLAKQFHQGSIALNLGNGVQIAGFCKLVERFLPHTLALGVGEFLVDVRKPLGSDILLVVQRPNLVLAFVGNEGVF